MEMSTSSIVELTALPHINPAGQLAPGCSSCCNTIKLGVAVRLSL